MLFKKVRHPRRIAVRHMDLYLQIDHEHETFRRLRLDRLRNDSIRALRSYDLIPNLGGGLEAATPFQDASPNGQRCDLFDRELVRHRCRATEILD